MQLLPEVDVSQIDVDAGVGNLDRPIHHQDLTLLYGTCQARLPANHKLARGHGRTSHTDTEI